MSHRRGDPSVSHSMDIWDVVKPFEIKDRVREGLPRHSIHREKV